MNIPKNWKGVSTRQLIELSRHKNDEGMEGFATIASIFAECTPDEVKALNAVEFCTLVDDVTALMQAKPTGGKCDCVKLNGHEYHLRDIEEFTTAEFIDADTIATGDDSEKTPLLLALSYREDGVEDNPDNIRRRAKEMLELDAESALGAISFFIYALLKYVVNTAASSKSARTNNLMMKEAKRLEKIMEGWGDGDGR